ncbi:hypothetical protein [Streptomyces anulatus]|uniref:hypothetical protein n=1 Tax=Streptomyces anulatus TaxID=1892 RepID=UPI0015CF4F3C
MAADDLDAMPRKLLGETVGRFQQRFRLIVTGGARLLLQTSRAYWNGLVSRASS